MSKLIRTAAIAVAVSLSFGSAAFAQGKQQPAPMTKGPGAAKQAEPPPPAAPQQVALTDQQVQGFISVTPELNKVTENLQAEPDAKTQAQMDGIVKKGGFANMADYESVSFSIGQVMQGIDPQTKKFGDPKAMIQAQIKEVQGDKKMKPAEKKEALAELNQSLKDLQPIRNQGNIALVEKNFDKLAALMPEN